MPHDLEHLASMQVLGMSDSELNYSLEKRISQAKEL